MEGFTEQTVREKRQPIETRPAHPRAILVGADLIDAASVLSVEDSLGELRQLVHTVEIDVVGQTQQRLRNPHPATFVGKGKVEEIKTLALENQADVVIFDDELSPSQQRNLEEQLKVPVIDRSQVILDVFATRARTREGRLQVELASFEYQLPRLTGAWTHLSRQFGRGASRGGPGETQLELDRRQIRKRIADLKRQIEGVREQRQMHRENRREHGLKVVALVGYTNAGKSTLFNALVRAGIPARDRPFDTLDPTTRRLRLPSGTPALLSDTVGFIQKLPVTLVAAFRATLEELNAADLLVHVLDVTHPRGYEQGVAVNQTLASLGLADKPTVTALNKIDRMAGMDGTDGLDDEAGEELRILLDHYPHAVAVSAAKGWHLGRLLTTVDEALGVEVAG
ncbi:MAG TPA: GTPase HflX [Chloroflexota bacterium]|nr:GTPase HflX [Chloroflexota bacterium]